VSNELVQRQTDRVSDVLALRNQNVDLPQPATISSGVYRFFGIAVPSCQKT